MRCLCFLLLSIFRCGCSYTSLPNWLFSVWRRILVRKSLLQQSFLCRYNNHQWLLLEAQANCNLSGAFQLLLLIFHTRWKFVRFWPFPSFLCYFSTIFAQATTHFLCRQLAPCLHCTKSAFWNRHVWSRIFSWIFHVLLLRLCWRCCQPRYLAIFVQLSRQNL